jgi:membrane associated rhomboid family serine protease
VRTASGVVIRARRPVVTHTIMALCVIGYLLQLFVPGFSSAFVQANVLLWSEPWRMLTAGFLHDTSNPLPVHLALNMLSLWFLGRALEPVLGHWRFAAVFCVGVVGGSVAQALLTDPLSSGWGASGGIFAIGAALLVELRHDRQALISMAVVLGINLAYGFMIGSNVSWQAHVGGLVTGLVLGGVYASGSQAKQHRGAYHVACTVIVAIVLVAAGMYLGLQARDEFLATYGS